ncbi:hypothetical protein [Sorangium sp. So ce1097]|uniref:hypothetical protein n=1 Tax=Sorangium sp. So ce1097 TaxID=3133330 RepID=UPI003F63ADE8
MTVLVGLTFAAVGCARIIGADWDHYARSAGGGGDGAGTGSMAATGGNAGAAGAQGDGGAGGGASSTAASGGGGEGGCGVCKDGEFCTASEICVRCTDRTSVLSFGRFEEIGVEGTSPAFPRVRAEPDKGDEAGYGAEDVRLVYVASFGSSNDRQIATATGRPWTGGAVIASAIVNTAQMESGPLLLPVDAPSPREMFPPGSLLFDRFLPGPGSPQKLFIADALEATSAVEFETLNRDWGSHSMAVAHAARPYRYWFMNEHQDIKGTTSRLVTTRAHDAAPQELDITLPGDCPAQGDDLAPWVTPDGGVLFFQAPYSPHGDCAKASVLRSFYVKLGPDGLPLNNERARLLLSVVGPNHAVMTPSLSPDECTLYFASDVDGMQRLYSAERR